MLSRPTNSGGGTSQWTFSWGQLQVGRLRRNAAISERYYSDTGLGQALRAIALKRNDTGRIE